MKTKVFNSLLIGFIVICGYSLQGQSNGSDYPELREGDIIFQTSLSSQSKAIQLATKSKFSHCGILYRKGNEYYVFEAIQPVKETPIAKWIARGENGKYVIKRINNRDSILTDATIDKMKKTGDKFLGKNYDLTFEWSDDKMYCSELIWKVYKRSTGLELGKLQKLKEFDLASSVVSKKLNDRYGNKIPLDEIVISPSAIFASKHLVTVQSN